MRVQKRSRGLLNSPSDSALGKCWEIRNTKVETQGAIHENRSYRGQWVHRIKTRSQVGPARARCSCRISQFWCQFCYGRGAGRSSERCLHGGRRIERSQLGASAVLNFFETSTRNLLKYGA